MQLTLFFLRTAVLSNKQTHDQSSRTAVCVFYVLCFISADVFVSPRQVILDESQKFFKLLELLGKSDQQESTLIFVDKQESAGETLKRHGR